MIDKRQKHITVLGIVKANLSEYNIDMLEELDENLANDFGIPAKDQIDGVADALGTNFNTLLNAIAKAVREQSKREAEK